MPGVLKYWDGSAWAEVNVPGYVGPTGTWALAQTVETKTGAYEIASEDAGKVIRMNATANFTVTSTTRFSV